MSRCSSENLAGRLDGDVSGTVVACGGLSPGEAFAGGVWRASSTPATEKVAGGGVRDRAKAATGHKEDYAAGHAKPWGDLVEVMTSQG